MRERSSLNLDFLVLRRRFLFPSNETQDVFQLEWMKRVKSGSRKGSRPGCFTFPLTWNKEKSKLDENKLADVREFRGFE